MLFRSATASEALAAALEAESVLEWDPKTGQGLLVLGTSTRSGLELGTPTVELLLESGGNAIRQPVVFRRDALERPRLPGDPRDGGVASALHDIAANVSQLSEASAPLRLLGAAAPAPTPAPAPAPAPATTKRTRTCFDPPAASGILLVFVPDTNE